MKNKYFVSRQHYYPDGDLFVEIASGGLDFANPDMLTERYASFGEGQEFEDPREAAQAAINVRDAWQKDSEEEINLGYGYTGGMTMPFSPSTDEDVIKWAEKAYEKLPKCDRCCELLKETYSHELLDEKYCSAYCAEESYCDLLKEDETAREKRAKEFIKNNWRNFIDDCNELNSTALAEAAAHEVDCDHWLDDETHPVWDWALDDNVT